MVTSWAGGAAAIKRLSYSHRGMALLGDTLTCRGKITKKYEEEGEPQVDLAITIETQKGEVTTLGRATVRFARRRCRPAPSRKVGSRTAGTPGTPVRSRVTPAR
jgi:hypothetical protein